MDESLTYYSDLISRYFAGEASSDEIQLLSVWIKESEDNIKLFKDYKKAWELIEQSMLDQKIDLEDEWTSLSTRIKDTWTVNDTKTVPLYPGKGNHQYRNFVWKIAASVFVMLVSASILFYYYTTPQMVIITADAGPIERVLPDGSIITLNKGATIEYPAMFSGKTRPVKLTGEAFFSVSHDKSRPFIVTGENVNVEVLGTTFNMNTNTLESKLSVVLSSGKVSLSFTDRSAEKVILLPGEKVEIATKSHRIIKTLNTDPNFNAWKTGRIVFDNVPLSNIIRTLNSVYHTRIVLADSLTGSCRVTASFDHQPVESVLNVLKGTLDLSVSKAGNVITLTGKPCK